MKKSLLLSLILFYTHISYSQMSIGNVSSIPDPSAMLEVKPSTTTNAKGFRLPNLNTSQISGITSPATGLLVADISFGTMQYRSSSEWLKIPAFSSATSSTLNYTHVGTTPSTLLNITNYGVGAGIEGTNFSQSANARGVGGYIFSSAGGVGASGVYGKNFTLGVNGSGVTGEHIGTGTGVLGKSNGGIGVSGQSLGANSNGIWGTTDDGKAVHGNATNLGYAGYFEAVGLAQALYTSGSVQFQNNGEANERVLTSDALGGASWQDLPKIAFMAYTINTMYVVPALSTQTSTFDATDFNIGNGFSTSTERFTAPKSGIYHFDSRIDALVSNSTNTSFYQRIIIYNAAGLSQYSYQNLIYPTTANSPVQYQLSIDAKMNSTDYAVVQISTLSGISVSIEPGRFTTFSGHYVCGL
jgi:hypothetical protein